MNPEQDLDPEAYLDAAQTVFDDKECFACLAIGHREGSFAQRFWEVNHDRNRPLDPYGCEYYGGFSCDLWYAQVRHREAFALAFMPKMRVHLYAWYGRCTPKNKEARILALLFAYQMAKTGDL